MFERIKTEAFDNGFDAGQNEVLGLIGPLLDDWDRLSNDEKGQVSAIAPLFVRALEHLKSTAEAT
jgi:hypothetical protein